MITTIKDEVLAAGRELASRTTPAQRANHEKVLAWIESLPSDSIPDYSHHEGGRLDGALLSYKLLIRAWYDANVCKN